MDYLGGTEFLFLQIVEQKLEDPRRVTVSGLS